MIPTPTELSRLVEMFRWLASFIYLDQGASGFIMFRWLASFIYLDQGASGFIPGADV